MSEANPKPIINCHTHIFIGKNVPPYIARQFIPWPFYKILTVPLILAVCRFWYMHAASPYKWKFRGWHKKLQRAFYAYRVLIKRNVLLDWLVFLMNVVITYHALIYFFEWLTHLFIKPDASTADSGSRVVSWLRDQDLFYDTNSGWLKAAIILFTLLFIASGRKLLLFLLRSLWRFLVFLPDPKTIQFIARYINIGRFAYYHTQALIFSKLESQYPKGSCFVILPMDMEFMDAGKLDAAGSYKMQMEELAILKEKRPVTFFPFVFIDPRRKRVGDKPFFAWQNAGEGKVVLGKCFIKEYIEHKGFKGFKIYPALGYYPFDETLLPLWKYAADNRIPVLTHCIRGTIFYRGIKQKEWDYHPVLQQAEGHDGMQPLLLPELKNIDFINNFTHPLNYLCLLNERLLRVLVGKASDPDIKTLFGYTNADTALQHDLKHLKLCFGHYGGEDEWQKYFENDRDNFTSQVVTSATGIQFTKPGESMKEIYNRLEHIWKGTDWFSIITSIMLQYENVYADISYIIHNNEIIPLLKYALNNNNLKYYILFGTDFYVVRNHKSEKEMLAHIQATLTTAEFDLIARDNPRRFLGI